ncbi:MAG: 2,3-bisphosphoglycerate-independent phosphoglycerate mutase [Trueperaceae bacterium]|nr:2,3-bisphosphoglycerate-independent phosphoglycerate mutase [Trueperaceae bacterium]
MNDGAERHGGADGRTPVAVIVLDGFGLAPDGPGNAVTQAATPTFDALWREAPHTTLEASGPAVGLPEGQMGNSEVGHMNLGAGRVVQQSLSYLTTIIEDGSIAKTDAFSDLCAAADGATLHLLGLVSDGGVHADLEHLTGLLDLAVAAGVARIRVHAFTDGRDTAPDGGRGYLRALEAHLAGLEADARIASVVGRYYAMDRDERWARTEEAFRAVVCGEGLHEAGSASEAIDAAYARGETDEFVRATVISEDGAPVGPVRPGDAALFANFRADRARQLTRALSDPDFAGFDRCADPRPHLATLMPYDDAWPLPALATAPQVERCLADVVSAAGRTQFHAAETEKYPHVTYFFNAKIEAPFPGEARHIEPSPKVATYDLQPEMSAPALTDAVLARLEAHDDAFVLVNYANPDMVGHTGDLGAAVQACEAVDRALGRLLEGVRAKGGVAIVLADHGNAETMLAADGGPHTAHTTNPVPCIVTGAGPVELREGGVLGDVAPTVLALLGVAAPPEMTGRSLLRS